jgi:hypothetical protein
VISPGESRLKRTGPGKNVAVLIQQPILVFRGLPRIGTWHSADAFVLQYMLLIIRSSTAHRQWVGLMRDKICR